jgi:hypothetical protein
MSHATSSGHLERAPRPVGPQEPARFLVPGPPALLRAPARRPPGSHQRASEGRGAQSHIVALLPFEVLHDAACTDAITLLLDGLVCGASSGALSAGQVSGGLPRSEWSCTAPRMTLSADVNRTHPGEHLPSPRHLRMADRVVRHLGGGAVVVASSRLVSSPGPCRT